MTVEETKALRELTVAVGRLDERVRTVFEHYATKQGVSEAVKCHEQERHGSGNFKRPGPGGRNEAMLRIAQLLGALLAGILGGQLVP